MEGQEILGQAQDWILGRLQERQSVFIPQIGVFSPKVEAEYLWHKRSGTEITTYLMPPRIRLDFTADDYLLDGELYASYGAEIQTVSVPSDMILGISGLLEIPEEVVKKTLSDYLTEVIRSVFKGKRQQLFGLCDLFVTEEKNGLLLLNMEPLGRLLEQLNYPFSSYSPVVLQRGVTFPGIDESDEEYTNLIQQIPVHPVQEPETKEIEIPAVAEVHMPEPEVVEEPIVDVAPTVAPVASPVNDIPERRPRYKWIPMLVGALAVIAIVWVVVTKPQKPQTPTVSEQAAAERVLEEPIVKDSVIQEALPLDTVTLTSGMTLAKLARQYYNNPKFWIYIYMQNKDIIPDPNNVAPGTSLVIPSLDKYDVLPDSLAARDEAIQWEYIILTGNFKSFEEQRKTLKPYTK